jgi:hypothetical protein
MKCAPHSAGRSRTLIFGESCGIQMCQYAPTCSIILCQRSAQGRTSVNPENMHLGIYMRTEEHLYLCTIKDSSVLVGNLYSLVFYTLPRHHN